MSLNDIATHLPFDGVGFRWRRGRLRDLVEQRLPQFLELLVVRVVLEHLFYFSELLFHGLLPLVYWFLCGRGLLLDHLIGSGRLLGRGDLGREGLFSIFLVGVFLVFTKIVQHTLRDVRRGVARGRVRPFGVALWYVWRVAVLPALLDQCDVEHVSRREELLRHFRD